MAGKKKTAIAGQRQTKQKAAKPVGIVVRRGALRRFDALTRKTANLPVVLLWDRRQTNRRGSNQPSTVDGRKTQRRQKPPFTWEVADFVVIDSAPRNGNEATPSMAKAAKRPAAPRTKKPGKAS